jgi:hypothetical protein
MVEAQVRRWSNLLDPYRLRGHAVQFLGDCRELDRSPLDTRHVRPVHTGLICQVFLGPPALLPRLPHTFADPSEKGVSLGSHATMVCS